MHPAGRKCLEDQHVERALDEIFLCHKSSMPKRFMYYTYADRREQANSLPVRQGTWNSGGLPSAAKACLKNVCNRSRLIPFRLHSKQERLSLIRRTPQRGEQFVHVQQEAEMSPNIGAWQFQQFGPVGPTHG